MTLNCHSFRSRPLKPTYIYASGSFEGATTEMVVSETADSEADNPDLNRQVAAFTPQQAFLYVRRQMVEGANATLDDLIDAGTIRPAKEGEFVLSKEDREHFFDADGEPSQLMQEVFLRALQKTAGDIDESYDPEQRALYAAFSPNMVMLRKQVARVMESEINVERAKYSKQRLEDVIENATQDRKMIGYFSDTPEGHNAYVEAIEDLKKRFGKITFFAFDIDHFKGVNDFGHDVGDFALERIAAIVKGECREDETVFARYGGEEFGVVIGGHTDEELAQVAERLRREVEENPLYFNRAGTLRLIKKKRHDFLVQNGELLNIEYPEHGGNGVYRVVRGSDSRGDEVHLYELPITVSVGVSTLKEDEEWELAKQRSDEYQIQSKQLRNSVTHEGVLLERGTTEPYQGFRAKRASWFEMPTFRRVASAARDSFGRVLGRGRN